jgi:hypothetical protein
MSRLLLSGFFKQKPPLVSDSDQPHSRWKTMHQNRQPSLPGSMWPSKTWPPEEDQKVWFGKALVTFVPKNESHHIKIQFNAPSYAPEE